MRSVGAVQTPAAVEVTSTPDTAYRSCPNSWECAGTRSPWASVPQVSAPSTEGSGRSGVLPTGVDPGVLSALATVTSTGNASRSRWSRRGLIGS